MSRQGTLLITGADGFIGSKLIRALDALHWQARKAIRNANPSGKNVVVVGNIDGHTDWQHALGSVDTVVHLAGRAHVMRESAANALAEYRRVNVDGTARLARDAAAHGIRRLIFLSSVKVNGEDTGKRAPYSEHDIPQPLDAYGVSKCEAEDMLRRIGAETGMETVILRPPLVYGPGVKGNFLWLLHAVSRGWPLPLASIDNQRSLIYVDNLVDAIITCIDAPAASGKTFLVSDGEDISTPALIGKLAAGMMRTPQLLPCPVPLLRAGAALLGKSAPIMRLTGSLTIDGTRICRELGWLPRYSLDQGLTATAQWYYRGQN